MRRLLFLAALSLSAAACKFEAPGRCSSPSDCQGGLVCLEGVCGLCRSASDCDGWESCSAARTCVVDAGRCNLDADCNSWDYCDATHTCTFRPDHCQDDSVCLEWEHCDGNRHCSLDAGRCYNDNHCSAWAYCDPSHTCNVSGAAGGDVLLWGTLSEGACWLDAVAPVLEPTRIAVGTDCYTSGSTAVLATSGALYYVSSTKDAVVRYVNDGLTWTDGYWAYPTDGESDDPVVLDPSACAGAGWRWAVQGGTGALMLGCYATGGYFYETAAGAPIPGLSGTTVLSWNANDFKLVSGSSGFAVIDPAGVAHLVTGLPASEQVQLHRATATGFRVSTYSGTDSKLRRWAIGEDGAATLEGVFHNTFGPSSFTYPEVMDSAGYLYSESWGVTDTVVRIGLEPEPVTVIYSEADAPANANDWDGSSFNPFVYLHISYLVSGP